jgi:hypothetical protein
MSGIITNDDGARRYLKEIKTLIPIFGKDERLFFSELTTEVEDYVASNAPTGYEGIVSRFGRPNVVVSDYIDNADVEHIIKQIRTAKTIKIVLLIAIVAVIATLVAVTAIRYIGYLEGQEHYLDREVIEIEEE